MPSQTNGYCEIQSRSIVSVAGIDRKEFLQNLLTNNMNLLLPSSNGIYACLLTPQGKFMFDMIVYDDAVNDRYLLEVERQRSDFFIKKMSLYRLRSRVSITNHKDEFKVMVVFGDLPQAPVISFPDPRSAKLGIHCFVAGNEIIDLPLFNPEIYERMRIMAGVPDGSRDIRIDIETPAEVNIDLLNGVSFAKGCFVGQEVVARIENRGLLKKRMMPVQALDADVALKCEDKIMLNGVEIGEIRSSIGDLALAIVKIDALKSESGWHTLHGTPVKPVSLV